jgi:hypothetical protein
LTPGEWASRHVACPLFAAGLCLAGLAILAAACTPYRPAEKLRLLVHLLETVTPPRLGLGVGGTILHLRPCLASGLPRFPRLSLFPQLALAEALTLATVGETGPLVAAERPLGPVVILPL